MAPLSRRSALALSGAALAASGFGAGARAAVVDDPVAAFTGGAAVGGVGVTLGLPYFAENGISVPVVLDAPGAEALLLLAPANPDPQAAMFRFGPCAGSQRVETRLRLAESQTVRLLARFPDGRCAEATAAITVAIGGCPG